MKFWTTIICTLFIGLLSAQDMRRCKMVGEFSNPVKLDSLPAIPGSFSISSPADISYNINTNELLIQPLNPLTDSIEVCYNVLLYNPVEILSNRELKTRQNLKAGKSEIPDNIVENSGESLTKYGGISRSMGYGNRVGSSMVSDMDIVIEGNLTDTLQMKAHIRDKNVPFQPEGNSQYISEYDNIHLSFYTKKHLVGLGDLQHKSDSSFYLRYVRQLQGIGYDYNMDRFHGNVTLAVNKGKSHRVTFRGEEGVQGPYKINGPEKEPFIVVIANSERVFIDGELKERGQDRDYIIDYNLAEITFNPDNIITRYSRIVIQFEYLNRNFNRTTKTVYHKQQFQNLEVFTSYYGSNDVLSSVVKNMDENDLELLTHSDSPVNSFRSSPFDPAKVSYIKRDTTILGNKYTVFEYSRDPSLPHYQLTFANVGMGNGDYERDGNTVDKFIWVGEGLGNYNPVGGSFSPEKINTMSTGAKYSFNSFENAGVELVASRFDSNTLNPQNGKSGIATKAFFQSEGRAVKFLPNYKLKFISDIEMVDENLVLQDPFRPVEFSRDWNDFNNLSGDENILKAGVELANDTGDKFGGESTLRLSGGNSGHLSRAHFSKNMGQFRVFGNTFNMKREGSELNYNWARHKLGAGYSGHFFNYQYRFDSDHNSIVSTDADSIHSSLQFFDAHTYSLSGNENLPFRLGINYMVRQDQVPVGTEFSPVDNSKNLSLNTGKDWENYSFDVKTAYRELVDNINPENGVKTFNGSLASKMNMFGGLIKSDLRMETATGWEPVREFTYVEVQQGRGHYTWQDTNGDGKKQLDEFFDAIHPDQMNYIRLYTPGVGRQASHNTSLFTRVHIKVPQSWNTGLDAVKALSADINFRKTNRISSENPADRFHAMLWKIENPEILSGSENLKAGFQYKPESQKYVVSSGISESSAKSLIFDGYELRNSRQKDVKWIFKHWDFMTLELFYINKNEKRNSDVIAGNNFEILSNDTGLRWQSALNRNNLSVEYRFIDKSSSDRAVINELSMGLDFTFLDHIKIGSKSVYKNILFEGEHNTRLSYTILEGLNPGNNFIWIVNIVKPFDSGIDLGIFYNGRKSTGRESIHAGQVKFSYRF